MSATARDALIAGAAGGALFVAFACAAILAYGRSRDRATEAEPGSAQRVLVQLGLWIVPSVIVATVFLVGLRAHVDAAVTPGEALPIVLRTDGTRWQIDYGNGLVVEDALRVPIERPVSLSLVAEHGPVRLAAPAIGLRLEARPGHDGNRWLVAPSAGETQLLGSPTVGPRLVALAPPEYERWQLEADGGALPPAEYGRKLYTRSQCQTCHSLDGTVITGPSFKGLFGRREKLTGGAEVQVDAAYLKESILDPAAKVVDGFQPVMPPYSGQLDERQLAALIAFIEAQQP